MGIVAADRLIDPRRPTWQRRWLLARSIVYIRLGESMGQKERILILAGWLSAAVAALHVVIVFLGAPAYRYFGAGEDMDRQAEAGSLVPAVMTLAITAVFAVFALYAFAGAGRLRRLPLLRTGLVAISAIYLVRGLSLLPELAGYAQGSGAEPRHLAFSLTSLVIGLFYLAGTVLLWPSLKARAKDMMPA